jgi:hypothetical protein
MSKPDIVWLVWFLVFVVGGLVYFGVAEGLALHNDSPGGTLTEVIRSMNLPIVVWFAIGGLIVGIVFWLVPHLANRLGL